MQCAPPLFFARAEDFRAWLSQHAASTTELIVGFHKVGSGTPSMSWPEAVDEALCVGWIDGVRRRIDERTYQIRFTARKKGSIWSAVNIAKVEALTAEGRMTAAGLEAYERRTAHRSKVYSYEQDGEPVLALADLRQFKKNKAAWAYFEAVPPGYRKTIVHWVLNAKQPATRARRLVTLIEACAAGLRLR